MWKNDCGVLRDDTAHHNCGRQQVDMVHLPSGTLSILCPDDSFYSSQQLRTRTQIYQCTSIKQAVGHLAVLKHISGHNRQKLSFTVKRDINQTAVCALTYKNYNKRLQCGHLEEQMAAEVLCF